MNSLIWTFTFVLTTTSQPTTMKFNTGIECEQYRAAFIETFDASFSYSRFTPCQSRTMLPWELAMTEYYERKEK